MRRLAALTALVTTLALTGAGVSAVTATAASAAGPVAGTLQAGAAVVDDTWHVGASAGQYASSADGTAEWDPNFQSVKNNPSYGVASRLSVRALVLQSGSDAPVAMVKQDLYLAQDLVVRRAAQILAADGSKVTTVTRADGSKVTYLGREDFDGTDAYKLVKTISEKSANRYAVFAGMSAMCPRRSTM